MNVVLACRLLAYYTMCVEATVELVEPWTSYKKAFWSAFRSTDSRCLLTARVTMKLSIKPSYFLGCLVSLATAIPKPLTLEETTSIRNNLGNNLSNLTLPSVIPNGFVIRPSGPLDEPVLNRRLILFLTLRVLGDLAFDDFYGEQQSRSWRSPLRVSIDIVGPAMVIESPLPKRKYAVWGIYSVIRLMTASNDFRPRNYELYWQGTLVGHVGFNNGFHGALGLGGGSVNETVTAIQQENLSVSPVTLPKNASTSSRENIDVTLVYELHGGTIGETSFFMTLYTGIVKAAPYYGSEQVEEFVVDTRAFSTYLSFKGREDLEPAEPYLEYAHVIELLAQLPLWALEHGGKWREANMVALVNNERVGAGVLERQGYTEVGAKEGGNAEGW